MQTTIVNNKERLNAYPGMFGSSRFKGMPLFVYAENLFYNGLSQMVENYSGGHFDFIRINPENEQGIDIVPEGFMPLVTSTEQVHFSSPFGVTKKMSFRASCLVTWIFVIEQIANNSTNIVIAEKIYRVIEDLKYTYSDLLDENGNNLFSKDDCNSIYRILD